VEYITTLKTQEMEVKELRDQMYSFWIKYKLAPEVAESLADEFWDKTVAELLSMPDKRIKSEIRYAHADRAIWDQAWQAVEQARASRDKPDNHFHRIASTTSTELNPYFV